MKLGKAFVIAASAAAAVGAAVYAKRKLEQSEIPLKKKVSEDEWKSADEYKHGELVRSKITEERQTAVISEKIAQARQEAEKPEPEKPVQENSEPDNDGASQEAAETADTDNAENAPDTETTENSDSAEKPVRREQKQYKPVSFTFTEQEDVSFEDVFSHFNEVEKSYEEERDRRASRVSANVKTVPVPTAEPVAEKEQTKPITEEQTPQQEQTAYEAVTEEITKAEAVEVEEQTEPVAEEQTPQQEQAAYEAVTEEITKAEAPAEAVEAEEQTEPVTEPVPSAEPVAEEEQPKPAAEEKIPEQTAAIQSKINEIPDEFAALLADTEKPVNNTESADARPRTMDFFDLPDTSDNSAQQAQIEDDRSVSVEELFGDLLAEPEEKPEPVITSPSEVFSMFDSENTDDFDNYKDEKIEAESEKKKTTDTRRQMAQVIADNIESFSQLLEPLYAVKENKVRGKSGILFDWEMRIQSLIGDLPIKTYWRRNFQNYEIWTDEKYMEKAGEFLSMLELAGITRDNAKEVVIDRDTLRFYSAQSEHLNNDFHIGETAVVVRPCWRVNGNPARKGEIAKKAPFAEFSHKKVSPLEQMLRANSCDDGDVNIPVLADNFCSFDRDIPYIKQAIDSGFCKCAVRRMEDGGALAFFYEVIAAGDSTHYDECTLRFEISIDKNGKLIGRFKGEKV